MAAALRLLRLRQAAATSTLALQQPLIPASTARALYSKPPSPLHAMGAGGLHDLRRAQLCSSPVPSLLRLYSSKGFPARVLQQPIEHRATCHLKKGNQHIQHSSTLKWFVDRVKNDIEEQYRLIDEAMDTCEKACHLLIEGSDDQASAMFDQGMEDFLKALDVVEKLLDDYVEVIVSNNELPLDTQEKCRLLQKEVVGSINSLRQSMKSLAKSVKKRAKGACNGKVPMGPGGIADV